MTSIQCGSQLTRIQQHQPVSPAPSHQPAQSPVTSLQLPASPAQPAQPSPASRPASSQPSQLLASQPNSAGPAPRPNTPLPSPAHSANTQMPMDQLTIANRSFDNQPANPKRAHCPLAYQPQTQPSVSNQSTGSLCLCSLNTGVKGSAAEA